MLVLRGWVSGVIGNPWSVAGIAALSTNGDTRTVVASLPRGDREVKYRRLAEGLRGWSFRLGYFVNKGGEVEYGVIAEDAYASGVARPVSSQHKDGGDEFEERRAGRAGCVPPRPLPFWMLSVWGRVFFALFMSGLLVVILYYNNTGGDTPFNLFMSQRGFGVRFLFTSVGVIISFFWGSFFDGKPYPSSLPPPAPHPPPSPHHKY